MTALDRLVYSRSFGRFVLDPVTRWGYARHRRTGETPTVAYRSMRKLFGNADPRLFGGLVASAAADRVPRAVEAADGIAASEVNELVAALDRDGFAILSRRLDESSCADLESIARAAMCELVGPIAAAQGATEAVFDEHRPIAVRYEVHEEDVVASAAAQRLIADPSLLAVARRHLGAEPVQDLVTMWWSAAVGAGSSSAAAQLFHFDLDRLRFVKVFVFLTDVDEDTGPHVYVRGSHRHQPAALRRDGRHEDAAVAAAHPGEERRITGARGTVFLADTIGLHKGLALRRDHRLVFQTEYATSLFGAPYTRPVVVDPSPELRAAVAEHPRTFTRFRIAL